MHAAENKKETQKVVHCQRALLQTYQTPPCQTLILLYRHISSFSTGGLKAEATERGSH